MNNIAVMNNKEIKIAVGVIIAAVTIAVGWFWLAGDGPSANLDAFAQCLAEKKITMYGAEWCPHCLNEKNAFGDSFKYVPYVECPEKPDKCLAAGIRGYPT